MSQSLNFNNRDNTYGIEDFDLGDARFNLVSDQISESNPDLYMIGGTNNNSFRGKNGGFA